MGKNPLTLYKKSAMINPLQKLSILLFCFLWLHNMQAQTEEDLQYIYIETLSAKTYSNWIKSIDKNLQKEISYSCLPAKIIGLKKRSLEPIKTSLLKTYKQVDILNNSRQEVEKKCSSYRSFE